MLVRIIDLIIDEGLQKTKLWCKECAASSQKYEKGYSEKSRRRLDRTHIFNPDSLLVVHP